MNARIVWMTLAGLAACFAAMAIQANDAPRAAVCGVTFGACSIQALTWRRVVSRHAARPPANPPKSS